MTTKRKKYNPKKYRFIYAVLRAIAFPFTRLVLGYRCKDKFKIKSGEPVVILSNHQTDADPFCILTAFKGPAMPIATDNIFSGKFRARLFSFLGAIPKKKGVSDIRTVAKMKKVIDGGGSILLFPEGNRTFCEFQFYISDSLVKLLKNFKATVVLFNLHGGTGRSPRFKNKSRKGKFYGEIKRVIKSEEYSALTDEEFADVIKTELRVFDSEEGNPYKSERRAEYLERVFFVCPSCKRVQTLFSKGSRLSCSACGVEAEYTEYLRFKTADARFPFTKMIEFWNFQKRFVSEMPIKSGEIVFADKNVKVVSSDPYKKRRLLYKGDISLDSEYLYYGNDKFDLKKIEIASVVSGRNLVFTSDGNDYTLRGDKRFNALKYAFIFNKLDTLMKRNGADKYFNLEEDG